MKQLLLILLIFGAGRAHAQRYLPGQRGLQLQYGWVNQSALREGAGAGTFLGAGWSVYNKNRAHLGIGLEYHRQFLRRERNLLPVEFFLLSGDLNPLLAHAQSGWIFLSLNLGAHGGYQRFKKGSKIISDTTFKKGAFVYGPHLGLEAEIFLSDRFALTLNGKERLMLGAQQARKLQSVGALGVKFIFNKGW